MRRQLSRGKRACLRAEQFAARMWTAEPCNSFADEPLPDTQDVVSLEVGLTTVCESVIYGHCRAAFQTEPSDIFDGQSVGPSDWVPIYQRYCQSNGLNTKKDHTMNLRRFFSGKARKWYDLQIVHCPKDMWTSGKSV